MELFEINLDGQILTVMRNSDGSFTILSAEGKIADIFPEINVDQGLTDWYSYDLIPRHLVKQIGDLIEAHDM